MHPRQHLRQLPLALWRHGYQAIPRLRDADGNIFSTRVLGHPAWVVRGRDLVEQFYDERVLLRSGALPKPLAGLLFGQGAVHGLDGAEHLHRKRLFLDLLDDEAVDTVTALAEEHLRAAWGRQTPGEPVDPFDLLVESYGPAVLTWAGTDLSPEVARRTSRDLAAIVDGFGGQGVAYLRAVRARRRCNVWATTLVRQARAEGDEKTIVGAVAHHRQPDGTLLPAAVAGVELLNIVRPTVAVAFLGAFLALSLEQHPEAWARLVEDETAARSFAQEVRRHAPFVPALMGRAACDASWGSAQVREGDRIVLDVPGVNHDPRRWDRPADFDPTRFVGDEPDEFDLVPQGGGDRTTTHRCPGEPLTISLLTMTARLLAGFQWSAFDPSYDERRIPARPRLRLVKR